MSTAIPPTPTVTDLSVDPREFRVSEHLAHARQQAVDRNYRNLLIVDADAHHYENEAWADIVKYIEDPTLRYRAQEGTDVAGGGRGGAEVLMGSSALDQANSGRVTRYVNRRFERAHGGVPRDVQLVRSEMESIGIDYQVVFPSPMLELGMHPNTRLEPALSWAYTRWMTEEILPHEPRMKTMVYLPFSDPDACLRTIETFAGRPGVAGFMVTAARHRPVHDNVYAPVYRALEETGMPLGFHAGIYAREPILEGMNRFLSMHAIGFVIHNAVHLTNIVINGLPERFPKLRFIFIESGLAWVPFIMQRLDHEYLMRTAEAPLLKKLPSEYIRDFYFTTQPMETHNHAAMQQTFDMIDAPNRLLFASDFPHWDFDLPSTVYDLPFLTHEQKRRILGGNAAELFDLPLTPLKTL